MLGRDLPLESETAAFVLLSTLDLLLTVFLMEHFPVREANPLAEFILMNWRYHGLVVYKFTAVAGVCILSQLIALRSVRTARFVMVTGCVLMAGLLAHSARLLLSVLE